MIMKTFLKFIALVLISSLVIGCKSYRPIEKVTSKNDPSLTKKENLGKQLNQISQDEKIQVFLLDGKSYYLKYSFHTPDTLYTNLSGKAKATVAQPENQKIPLSNIDEVKIWRKDYVLTFAVPGGVLVLTGIFLIYYMDNWTL